MWAPSLLAFIGSGFTDVVIDTLFTRLIEMEPVSKAFVGLRRRQAKG